MHAGHFSIILKTGYRRFNSVIFYLCAIIVAYCYVILPGKQMTDARCSRCSEFKVGVRDIIQAGHGDRYQVFFSF